MNTKTMGHLIFFTRILVGHTSRRVRFIAGCCCGVGQVRVG